MVDEVALFFGKGDFYSWKGIIQKYFPEHEADICKIKNVMTQITLNSLEAAQEVYTKETRAIFDRLEFSPVGIRQQCGIDFIQGVYNRITDEYPRPPDRRQYNSFPIPHKTGDGRIGANIPLYSVNSDKRTISVKGNSLEDYENKVFNRLRDTYLINRQYLKSDDMGKRDMLIKSADAVQRFHRVAKTVATRQNAESFIESVIQIDEKKFSDCPSVSGGS